MKKNVVMIVKSGVSLGSLLVLAAGTMGFRPPAVPLVSVEPHFSVWSTGNRLTDVDTTHWSGASQPLSIILTADGESYRLCGRAPLNVSPLPQKALAVHATETVYAFGNDRIAAELSFLTPRYNDDLDVYSRPVTYVTVKVTGAAKASIALKIDKRWATNDDAAEVVEESQSVSGLPAKVFARKHQKPFATVGDRRRADWGRVWAVGPKVEGTVFRFMLAYENTQSVRYFGRVLPDWWQRDGKSFAAMLSEADGDYVRLVQACRAFDAAFAKRATELGGEKYARIAELAWRQSFAACKLVAAPNGEPYMFSAENGSGGMIGTVDVLYPQMPHLLVAGAAFAKATLAPVCDYAASTNWPYAYAPHDLGLFPVAEGQYYGMKKGQSVGGGDDDSSRMPVEECGNMLLCLTAVSKLEGNADFASRWWPTVTSWANYLEKVGFDPENQLCTDDFAGHLAHNANLSIKTILALAGYGQMAKLRGDKALFEKYDGIAREMVYKWITAAQGGRHGAYRLAFDRPESWSMKYNLVWDRLLGMNLFPKEVAETELKAYRKLENVYGLPLDCRKAYTKADWLAWCGTLTGERSDLEQMVAPIYRFLDETPDRTPFGDWYETDCGLVRSFAARSVVGGVLIPFLGVLNP